MAHFAYGQTWRETECFRDTERRWTYPLTIDCADIMPNDVDRLFILLRSAAVGWTAGTLQWRRLYDTRHRSILLLRVRRRRRSCGDRRKVVWLRTESTDGRFISASTTVAHGPADCMSARRQGRDVEFGGWAAAVFYIRGVSTRRHAISRVVAEYEWRKQRRTP